MHPQDATDSVELISNKVPGHVLSGLLAHMNEQFQEALGPMAARTKRVVMDDDLVPLLQELQQEIFFLRQGRPPDGVPMTHVQWNYRSRFLSDGTLVLDEDERCPEGWDPNERMERDVASLYIKRNHHKTNDTLEITHTPLATSANPEPKQREIIIERRKPEPVILMSSRPWGAGLATTSANQQATPEPAKGKGDPRLKTGQRAGRDRVPRKSATKVKVLRKPTSRKTGRKK